jgi:hypothetical protein
MLGVGFIENARLFDKLHEMLGFSRYFMKMLTNIKE